MMARVAATRAGEAGMMPAFKGWPDRALAFYEGLEADNSKAYWLDHKEVYARDVRAPMEALLAELRDEFGEGRLFRPFRDTRFSKDKSPYKTAIAARIGQGYVSLSADGLLAGMGTYHMEADQLARYRAAVVADGSGGRLAATVHELRATGLDVHAMETLKTAPRGFPKDHARIDLLRMKGLVVSRHWAPASWLHTARAKSRVVEVFRAAAPLLGWLDAQVGPPGVPGGAAVRR
jgi:uncharacterized protein (TIGR02453 family)